jgi:hypothetical protein
MSIIGAELHDALGAAGIWDVGPSHIAAFIRQLQAKLTPPTVKQHLAALRMLLDWRCAVPNML